MGILYIDEAGNSGYKDLAQPNLVYGGPYIKPSQWRGVLKDYEGVAARYKALIYSRFNPPTQVPRSFEALASQVNFLNEFHFHARNIMVRLQLWGKLNDEEAYKVLQELVQIMIDHDVKLYVGLLNKQKLISNLQGVTGKIDSLIDFQSLIPLYFNNFEQKLAENEEYIVLVADGEKAEREILQSSLQSSNLKKCNPELIIKKAEVNPYLQLADVGLWVVQAYHKLDPSKPTQKSEKIKSLYSQLTPILNLFIY